MWTILIYLLRPSSILNFSHPVSCFFLSVVDSHLVRYISIFSCPLQLISILSTPELVFYYVCPPSDCLVTPSLYKNLSLILYSCIVHNSSITLILSFSYILSHLSCLWLLICIYSEWFLSRHTQSYLYLSIIVCCVVSNSLTPILSLFLHLISSLLSLLMSCHIRSYLYLCLSLYSCIACIFVFRSSFFSYILSRLSCLHPNFSISNYLHLPPVNLFATPNPIVSIFLSLSLFR